VKFLHYVIARAPLPATWRADRGDAAPEKDSDDEEVSSSTRICLRMLPESVSVCYEHACPHATKEKESDDEEVCMSAYSCICVRKLLYTMCPHICVSAYY